MRRSRAKLKSVATETDHLIALPSPPYKVQDKASESNQAMDASASMCMYSSLSRAILQERITALW